MIAAAIDYDALRRMHCAGATLAEIGDALGLTRNQVRHVCGKLGLTPRLMSCRCVACGRTVVSTQRVRYCCAKCKRRMTMYARCSCGRPKARYGGKCRECYEALRRTPDDRVANLYRQGYSMRVVSKRLGISVGAVLNALRRQCVASRPRGYVAEID